jgi:hypothetical protein
MFGAPTAWLLQWDAIAFAVDKEAVHVDNGLFNRIKHDKPKARFRERGQIGGRSAGSSRRTSRRTKVNELNRFFIEDHVSGMDAWRRCLRARPRSNAAPVGGKKRSPASVRTEPNGLTDLTVNYSDLLSYVFRTRRYVPQLPLATGCLTLCRLDIPPLDLGRECKDSSPARTAWCIATRDRRCPS